MSSGLLALLDDVVALAKLAAVTLDDAAGQAAQASAKAAGVVIDDAAVTPRYVVGLAAERELPIVARIAYGSLKNKLLYLLPAAVALSALAPWALTPILMVGGLYLCFEGYEKVHALLSGHGKAGAGDDAVPAGLSAQEFEDRKVAGAIRTDMVLSAEIMALALASIDAPSLAMQIAVLAAVSVVVTAGVYGSVALIVKADDFGVYLAKKGGPISGPAGRALVKGMPPFLQALSFVGMVAMLWVGGGILLHGLAHYGFTAPEHAVQAVSTFAVHVPVFGGILAWLCGALLSAAFGLVAGAIAALLWIALEPVVAAGRPSR